MAITDKLIQLMGGSILVESMPGEGSDFSVYLTLPLADHPENLAADDTAQDSDDFTYEGCNILMADDNEVNAADRREHPGIKRCKRRCSRKRT